MIIEWILFIITFCLGYYFGGKGRVIAEELKEAAVEMLKDRPKPGVVQKLTPEQIEDKHNPIKQGNKAAFDRFFRDFPPIIK